MKSSSALRQFLHIASSALLAATSAHAATITWDANGTTAGLTDGAGDWTTADQWWNGTTNVNWTSGDNAIFGNGGIGDAVSLSAPTAVGSLTFNSFTGTYTLGTSGQAITLNSGITMNSGAGNATLISPITLGAAQSWTNNSTGLLTVGPDAITNGGFLLTVTGTGNTAVSGAISGTGALTKSGTGTLTLSGANGYTGGTTVNTGGILSVNTIADSGTSAIGLSGTLTLAGGTFSYTGASAASTARQVSLTAADSTIDLTGGALTLGLVKSPNVGNKTLTKTGGGTLILDGTGDNSYLILNATAGVVELAKGIGANVRAVAGISGISSGATVKLNGAGTDQIFNGASGGISGLEGTFDLNGKSENISLLSGTAGVVDNTNATAVTFQVGQSDVSSSFGGVIKNTSGALSLQKTGSGTQTLSGANTYSGTTAIHQGTLILKGGNDRLSTTTAVTIGLSTLNGVLQLGDSAGASNQTLTGLATSGSGTTNAVVGGNASVSTLTINNSGNFTFGGKIGGTGTHQNNLALIKNGVGTLTLNGTNTFSGGVTLGAGQLNAGSNAAFGTGTLTISGGRIDPSSGGAGISITTTNANTWNASWQMGRGTTGSATWNNNGDISLGANIVVSAAPTSNTTYLNLGGVISDGGSNRSLSFGVTGGTTLSGANTYGGGTTTSVLLNINNGGTSSSNSAIGTGTLTIAGGMIDNTSGAASSTVTLATNNQLALNASFTYTGTGSRNLNLGTGAVTMASTRDITVSAGILTIGGNIASTSAGINKKGAGTLVLSGTNSQSGTIDNTAANSTVLFNGGASMGTSALQTNGTTSSTFHIQQDAAFSKGNFIIANGGSTMNLVVDRQTLASGTGMNYQFTAVGSSSGNQIGGGSTLAFSAGSNITPGTIPTVTFTQGIGSSSRTNDTATATLNPTGVNLVIAALGVQANGTRSWTLGGTSSGNSITGTIGAVASSTTAFIKNNTSTWTVSGNSTFAQSVSITNGVLKLGAAGSGANSPLGTVAGNTAVTSTGTLDLNGITLVTAEPLSLSGSGTSNSGALANTGAAATFSGPVSLGAAARIVAGGNILLTSATAITSGFGLTLDGAATGSSISTAINTGANSVTKEGLGTWTLSNSSNSYSGATTVTQGKLVISSTGNINSTSGISVAGGATFAYNSSTALTVAPALNGTGTTAATRAVLGGTGPINTSVTLNDVGDVLSPGNSPGIQNFTPAQTWSSFSYDWEVKNFTGTAAGIDFDQIGLASTLNLSGGSGSYILNVLGLTVLDVPGLVPNFSEVNRSWTILTSTGITGFSAANWTINTAGFSDPDAGTWALAQSGNNLVLSYAVVPEPRAALLGGLGVLMLFRRRR